jgi:hypothetical protein
LFDHITEGLFLDDFGLPESLLFQLECHASDFVVLLPAELGLFRSLCSDGRLAQGESQTILRS